MPSIQQNFPPLENLLAHRSPFLLVDEILEFSNDYIIVSKAINKEEFFLDGHFPLHPVVPGVILIEIMVQASAIYYRLKHSKEFTAPKPGKLVSVEKVVFYKEVKPKTKIIIRSEFVQKINNLCKFSVVIQEDETMICKGMVVILANG